MRQKDQLVSVKCRADLGAKEAAISAAFINDNE